MGSLWIVVDSCGVVVDRCGSLWVIVGRCGSFRVLVTTFHGQGSTNWVTLLSTGFRALL